MKRAGLVLLTIILACAIQRHVTLLLGPNATTPSSGFRCPDPNNPTSSLFGRSLGSGMLRFNVVVDLIDVGQHVPSCVGEDILTSCADGTCKATTAAAPRRYCVPIQVQPSGNPDAVAQKVLTALQANGSAITADAPHHPVIVRAVATMDDCRNIQTETGGVWAPLDQTKVLGCAYSCPIDLDTVDGDVSLGIGIDITTLTPNQCVAVIDACATVGD